MELFEFVFDRSAIYDMLFFNIKAVVEYPKLEELKERKPNLYSQWKVLSKTKYKLIEMDLPGDDSEKMIMQDLYDQYAVFYPEYTKIVAITFAKVFSEDGKLKRNFHKIVSENELENIETFQNFLLQISSDGQASTPQYFPTLCGHNIIHYDIPFFIKRLLAHRDNLENKSIPFIIKKYLQSKPWDSNIVDALNIWKFNGKDYTSLNMIIDFLGLKKSVELLSPKELSEYYWNNIEKDSKKTLEHIGLQSANQTNIIIQFINELRQF
jgi:hypothetical protein